MNPNFTITYFQAEFGQPAQLPHSKQNASPSTIRPPSPHLAKMKKNKKFTF